MRVVDRVHRHAAVVRALAEPAIPPGLAERDVHVVRVRHRTDAREALAVHETLFTRVQANRHVALVATHDLSVVAGRTGDCAALADLQLDIVDDRANRHGADRTGVTRLDVHVLARHDLVTRREALRSQDVALLAIGVVDQRDERGAVRIVLDPLHGRGHVELVTTLEIDVAQRTLVPTAAEADGDTAQIVAPARGALALGQRLHRLALIELTAVNEHELT